MRCPHCKAKIVALTFENGKVVEVYCAKCGKTTEIKEGKE